MWEIGVKILFHKDINIFRINNDFQYLKKNCIFAPLFITELSNEGSTASLFLYKYDI